MVKITECAENMHTTLDDLKYQLNKVSKLDHVAKLWQPFLSAIIVSQRVLRSALDLLNPVSDSNIVLIV